jgi:hypothetical protein
VQATTTGIPLVHPEPEPVDGFALTTKAIEALGLVAVLRTHIRSKGMPAWKRRGPSAQSLSR